MTTLQLDRVTKKFKSDVVLDEVSIEAEAGETLVIFGPSGSGKTVLLRVIAGVYEPEEGKGNGGGSRPSDGGGIRFAAVCTWHLATRPGKW